MISRTNSMTQASISVGACFSTAADIVACASLTIFLVSFRSDMGRCVRIIVAIRVHSESSHRSHSSLVDSLLIFTFNRGALFTLMQMGRMAAYLANPSVWYW